MVDTVERDAHWANVWMGKRWGGVLCCWLSPIWLIIVASFFERPPYRMMPFYDDQTLTGIKNRLLLFACLYSHLVWFRVEIFDLQLPPLKFLFFSKRLEKLTCAWIRCYIRASRKQPITQLNFFDLFLVGFFFYSSRTKLVVRDSRWLTTTTISSYTPTYWYSLSPLTLVLVCTK